MFSSSLANRLSPAIDALCATIAHHAARHRALASLMLLVWSRLRRLLTRLDRLATRWQTGALRPTRPGGKPGTTPHSRIPTGHAWLVRLVPPAAQFAPQVEALLHDPELASLLQAAPQAGRLLRPLCRMLGIDPPSSLRLPPRPPRAKPAAEPPGEPPPRALPPPPRPRLGPPFGELPARLRLRVPTCRFSSA
jgi:hypothetical protein